MRSIFQGINYIFGPIWNRFHLRLTYSLNYISRKREIDRHYLDYIRLATLEMVAHEINTAALTGAVAELGVYKGKFARYINGYFPNRKLYLFDTFEGFHEKDVQSEIQQNFSAGNQDFSDTSVQAVLTIMPHPAQCVVRKGFFPDTAKGLEEQFVFVSLDADLYDPILEGLNYFYPRLQKGGYIFIHDYNNDLYKGARKAVDEFCDSNGLSAIPLPDSCGTAVLKKSIR